MLLGAVQIPHPSSPPAEVVLERADNAANLLKSASSVVLVGRSEAGFGARIRQPSDLTIGAVGDVDLVGGAAVRGRPALGANAPALVVIQDRGSSLIVDANTPAADRVQTSIGWRWPAGVVVGETGKWGRGCARADRYGTVAPVEFTHGEHTGLRTRLHRVAGGVEDRAG